MDRFDLQIAKLKPTHKTAQLNKRQFMKKLQAARHARRLQRLIMGLMGLALTLVVAGALRRDILDMVSLTVRYAGELPSMFSAYASAYAATISWPSVAALALLALLGITLVRIRQNLGAYSKRAYIMAMICSVLALGLGATGLLSSSAQAAARQEALKRSLNERGHLEVQVSGKDYELYGQSQATDDSIRHQAFIEELRAFDISKAYPEFTNMNRDGFVVEVRAVNTKDDCIFYVERRLEPVLNKVVDANSGCIASNLPVHYLSPQLKPAKAPKWKTGQALYLTNALRKGAPTNSPAGHLGIAVILEGKADYYVAGSNSQKLVPKGQPGTGVQSCGIDLQDTCPQVGLIDVFTNAEGRLASGEIGSSVPGDSLRPRPDSQPANLFGKITAMDDRKLEMQLLSGQKLAVSWPGNVIETFNARGAKNYPTTSGTLRIQPGDHLQVHIYYTHGIDLEKLSIADVSRIDLAIKTTLPDALKDEAYSKDKAGLIEKY
jgi:hypothetical protein